MEFRSLNLLFKSAAATVGLAAALSLGGCSISDDYNGAVTDQRVIETEGVSRLVSCRYIRDVGRAPVHAPFSITAIFLGDVYIDWSSDDLFVQTIRSLEISCVVAVQADEGLKALLAKPFWDRDDRILWEGGISRLVSYEVAGVDGLKNYRSEGDNVTRRPYLNSLKTDIKNGTGEIEFDCEANAVVEGVLLQYVEDYLLDNDALSPFQRPSLYFLTSGQVMRAVKGGDDPGLHSWVVSSATGNIIETTVSSLGGDGERVMKDCYGISVEPYSFSDCVRNKPFICFLGEGALVLYAGDVPLEEMEAAIEALSDDKVVAARERHRERRDVHERYAGLDVGGDLMRVLENDPGAGF